MTKSQKLFSALKKAGVEGLRSRRSARAIADLVGREMTLSEIKNAMTDEKQVPLAKSHDWYFFEEDDQPIRSLGNGKYEVCIHFRQFWEEVPKEMITASFRLTMHSLRTRRNCETVYLIDDFQVKYTLREQNDKYFWETVEWLPDYFIAGFGGVRAIKELLEL